MGVPAFFRWLSKNYPSVIIECVEERRFDGDGNTIPDDTTKPNPNGIEFDNLYLDMNGIIHPCTHPEDKPAPKNEDEMMVAIFECIDRLFAIVRPRKLLYMAIDGVAPRAKMNQQRSRRFRASKETEEKATQMARLRKELTQKGFFLPPPKPKEQHFDSNCITPGTPFMDRLSKCLHYYIHDRLNNDPGWRNVKVILSDANVPGEGEHKIMEYIRRQRAQPDHDPNTHHVLCGADADLIMLGLATHEVNFTIIREEFKPNQPRPCDLCGQDGHEMDECVGLPEGTEKIVQEKTFSETKYIFVRLNVLREYLARELAMPNLPFAFDLERAIDDWVFMCFFVGNDFLPHLPSLSIQENAIHLLVRLYKNCCYQTGGWLTDSGAANLKRVQVIMMELGKREDEIFQKRRKRDLDFKARNRNQKEREKLAAKNFRDSIGKGSLGLMKAGDASVAHGAKQLIMDQRKDNMNERRGEKRSIDQVDNEDDETPDEVKLYQEGYRSRYYESKFEVAGDNMPFRTKVANEYARGLCWVLKYYYQGCVSWDWYFPYHYAPFAFDFHDCANTNVDFNLGEPFAPMEQLMSVFPAASRTHLPEPWGELMCDPKSNIIDFYPVDFRIDLNGKRYAWQGVALLPFVDEKRLKKALKQVYNKLTPEEKKRNTRGDPFLYVSVKHEAYKQLTDLYRMGMSMDTEVPISGKDFQGMQAHVLMAENSVEPNGNLPSPVAGMEELRNNHVVTVRFRDPVYPEGFIFPARKLKNAKNPPSVLEAGRAFGFNPNLPQASLDSSAHRMLGHHLPNPQGGGLLNNVMFQQGGRGGQGLLGACPTQEGLLGAAPGQGTFLGSGLGGQGTLLGSGIGQKSLLGAGPLQGMKSEGSVNLPITGPEKHYNSERSGQGQGGLLGLGPRRQGLLGDGPTQQGLHRRESAPNAGFREGHHQEEGLLGRAPSQEKVNDRGYTSLLGSRPQEGRHLDVGLTGRAPLQEEVSNRGYKSLLGSGPQEGYQQEGGLMGRAPLQNEGGDRGYNTGLLGSGPQEWENEQWKHHPRRQVGTQYQNDPDGRGFQQRSFGSSPWQDGPESNYEEEGSQGARSYQDSYFGTERKQEGLLGLSPDMSHSMNQGRGGGRGYHGNNQGNYQGRGGRGNYHGNYHGNYQGNYQGNNRGNYQGHDRGNYQGNNQGGRGGGRGSYSNVPPPNMRGGGGGGRGLLGAGPGHGRHGHRGGGNYNQYSGYNNGRQNQQNKYARWN